MLNVLKPCKRAFIRRFLSSQSSILYSTQSPGNLSNDSRENLVQIPMRKKWGKTAVLKALCDATPPDPLKYTQYPFDCPSNPTLSFHHKTSIVQSLKSGKLPVEHLKSSDPHFFNLDWIESPGFVKKCDGENMEISPDPEFQESTRELEELMKNKSIVEVGATCIQYLKSGVKISEQMMDKCIAFITFFKSRQKQKMETDVFELIKIISQYAPLSYSAQCMIMRCHASSHSPHCVKMFEDMISANNIPDVETINYLLSLRRNNVVSEIFAHKIFHHMNKFGLQPTIETFIGYLSCLNTHRNRIPENELAREFTFCLGEIEACGIEETLEFYLKMLSLSCHSKHANLSHAILDNMANKKLKVPDNRIRHCLGLLGEIMNAALQNQDLEMAKKLWETSRQDKYSKILLPSDDFKYFKSYLQLVLRHDTLENGLKTMRDLLPGRTGYVRVFIEDLLAAAIRQESPEFLIYVYAEISSAVMDSEVSYSWLKTAVRLGSMAEMDTLQQFKNICLILITNMYRENWEIKSQFLSSIAFLIAKSEDVNTLMDVMTGFKTKFPSKKIDDFALAECYRALHKKDDSSLLIKFQQMYPQET